MEKPRWLSILRHLTRFDQHKLPEIFNTQATFGEFAHLVEQEGLATAQQKIRPLLRKQLQTLVQEQTSLPLSPEFWYEIADVDGQKTVADPDYPSTPDVVERAKKGWQYADEQGFYDEIVERYRLEYEQMKTLIEEHILQDPLLALPTLQQLSELGQPQEFIIHGQKRTGYAGRYYALAMPASTVHKGGHSYFNLYRVVAVQEHDNWQWYVQTQGYFHQLSRKVQSEQLLSLDQPDTFTNTTEAAMMTRIIQLAAERKLDPISTLLAIGKSMGDTSLADRADEAVKTSLVQRQQIEQGIEAMVQVFSLELKKSDSGQKQRLKTFFEAIANPLILGKTVPATAIVHSYQQTLAQGQDRTQYLTSLLNVIPSLVNRAGGWTICGTLSAGGFMVKGSALKLNGFGGLKIPDGCMLCPACHHVSTNGNICSSCGFRRGMKLPSASLIKTERLSRPRTRSKPRPALDRNPSGRIVHPSHLLQFGPAQTVGLQHLFKV